MDKLIVACVQQRMRIPQTLDEHREDLRRFFRTAANKRARLIVFPELAGVMVTPPLLAGFRADLLKRADQARRRRSGLWTRISGSLAGTLARALKVDFRTLVAALLDVEPQRVWEAYVEVYGGLAREFDMTVVAPSAYLPDPGDGVVRNLAGVFSPGGELLGVQAKGVLHPEDEDLAQPGSEWKVIPTDVGRIGILIGNDILFPEVGRLLAYQGAEILVGQGAATGKVLYEKLRAGMLARMQDNQLFAAISFVVGHNEFSRRQREPFMGKSAILAPQELTPRHSGILVEMTSFRSEGVLAAVWDFPALQELWETSDTPVRRQMPLEQVGGILADLYRQMKRLPRRADLAELPAPDATPAVRRLEELPVVASVTTRWPQETSAGEEEPAAPEGTETPIGPAEDPPVTGFLDSARRQSAPPSTGPDDETQEMDVLNGDASTPEDA